MGAGGKHERWCRLSGGGRGSSGLQSRGGLRRVRASRPATRHPKEGAAPGWRDHLDAAPHSAWSNRIVIAKPCYAPVVNDVSLGKIGPSFTRIVWPVYLIPPNARQEGEPVICLSQSIQYRRDKPKDQAK